MKTKIRLYMGREQALIVQEFETLTKVASLALGGGKQGDQKKLQREAEIARVPQPGSFDELAGMMGMFAQ